MPYWRLSGYYFFYFASLGALVPYWGLYLQSRGFSALEIGQLMAILTATKIVAPLLWGGIADRTGQRMPLVRLGAALSVLGFGAVMLANGFWTLALALLVFGFFWNATLPQVESVTFNHLGSRPSRYALIRVWGSLGFVLLVLAMGLQLEFAPLGIVPYWVLALCLFMWINALLIPDSAPAGETRLSPGFVSLLAAPGVRAFLAVCVLMQISHGIYYAFYSIHLEAAGYGSTAVGLLWSLGVIAEVLIFLIMHPLLERFGARRLLVLSLSLAALRWILIGSFIEILAVQLFAQCLHAASFGVFHAAAIALVHRYFVGRTQGRGQALYSSLGFGVGGAAGNLLGGLLWADAGPALTFGMGALAAATGLAIAWRWLDRDEPCSAVPRSAG